MYFYLSGDENTFEPSKTDCGEPGAWLGIAAFFPKNQRLSMPRISSSSAMPDSVIQLLDLREGICRKQGGKSLEKCL